MFRWFGLSYTIILYNWLNNSSCSVAWNGLLGTPFLLQCGIRQGGVLSPFLFAIYANLGSVYMLVHCLLVVFCTRTTLHCFLIVVMDSRNLLI